MEYIQENCPDINKAFDLVNELKLWGINVKIFDEWLQTGI